MLQEMWWLNRNIVDEVDEYCMDAECKLKSVWEKIKLTLLVTWLQTVLPTVTMFDSGLWKTFLTMVIVMLFLLASK